MPVQVAGRHNRSGMINLLPYALPCASFPLRCPALHCPPSCRSGALLAKVLTAPSPAPCQAPHLPACPPRATTVSYCAAASRCDTSRHVYCTRA